MQVFYPTRAAARSATFGKLTDNGQQAAQCKRYARSVSIAKAEKPAWQGKPVFVRGKKYNKGV